VTRLRIGGIGRLWTPAGVTTGAAIHVEDGRVAWAGPAGGAEAPGGFDEEIDAAGALVTPGLIDAHTHPLYAGDRFAEIAARSGGASYAELAAAGGGIASTVAATRAAPADRLTELARRRLAEWPRGGATTVEAKTGYHLDRAGELAAVRILAGLDAAPGLPRLEVTFLAAHALPGEFAGDPDGYLRAAAGWSVEAAALGARSVDVFCDEGYFSVGQARTLLTAGRAAGLVPRVHADELARTGGALLAAELGAGSADHLLRITAGDARALAAAGVVATLCPLTALALGTVPPVAELRAAGATIALGTDHNPGTSGLTSMAEVVGLAVHSLGLSVAEALRAATAGGAAALRLTDRGTLAVGEWADLVVWDLDHEGGIAWALGGARPRAVLLAGRRLG